MFAVAAGLLGFVATKLIASVTAKLKLGGAPFTQQENTVCRIHAALVLTHFHLDHLCCSLHVFGFCGTYLRVFEACLNACNICCSTVHMQERKI